MLLGIFVYLLWRLWCNSTWNIKKILQNPLWEKRLNNKKKSKAYPCLLKLCDVDKIYCQLGYYGFSSFPFSSSFSWSQFLLGLPHILTNTLSYLVKKTVKCNFYKRSIKIDIFLHMKLFYHLKVIFKVGVNQFLHWDIANYKNEKEQRQGYTRRTMCSFTKFS